MPGKKTIAGISVSALAAMGIVVGTEGDVLIPAHLELKVPVQEVLADRVYEKFEYDENGDPIPSSRKEIALYAFKGGVARKMPNEIARTPNTYTQKIDDDSFVQTSTLGQKFIRDAETNEWHEVGYATTTPEVFTLKRSVTMYETNRAWADDTGFQLAGSGTNDASVGTQAWTTPGNITADDGALAAVSCHSVTANAENSVSLFVSGSPSGDDKSTGSTWPSGELTHGGSTDTWGIALTEANVEASNFGVGYSVTGNLCTSNYLFASDFGFALPTGASIDGIETVVEATHSSASARADTVEMKVYYTATAEESPTPSVFWFD